MNRLAFATAGIAMVVGLAASHEASAIQRLNLVNGAGACQGALPSYEGNLRKRPTAIANEGTANAFVSCSTVQDYLGFAADAYGIMVNNNTGAAVNVNCTLASGIKLNGQTSPILIPKSIPVPANGVAEVQWQASDNGGDPLPPTGNWSCNLPVGTEIGSVYVVVEDGSAQEPAP